MAFLKILMIKGYEHRKVLRVWLIIGLLFYAVHAWTYRDIYTVTAYNNDKISINRKKFLDYRFASMRKTYFGGAAADPAIPFGTEIELIPLSETDEKAIKKYFKGKTEFKIEDRGALIKGKRIDIFIPRRLGGRKTALRWGSRQMKIKLKKPNKKKEK